MVPTIGFNNISIFSSKVKMMRSIIKKIEIHCVNTQVGNAKITQIPMEIHRFCNLRCEAANCALNIL